jgi:hypothetical protein
MVLSLPLVCAFRCWHVGWHRWLGLPHARILLAGAYPHTLARLSLCVACLLPPRLRSPPNITTTITTTPSTHPRPVNVEDVPASEGDFDAGGDGGYGQDNDDGGRGDYNFGGDDGGGDGGGFGFDGDDDGGNAGPAEPIQLSRGPAAAAGGGGSGGGGGGVSGTDSAQLVFARQFRAIVEERDSAESKQRGERQERAEGELGQWRSMRSEHREKTATGNRQSEQELLQQLKDEKQNTNSWALVVKAIDTQATSTEGRTDAARMRSVLIQLKNNPLKPQVSAAEAGGAKAE